MRSPARLSYPLAFLGLAHLGLATGCTRSSGRDSVIGITPTYDVPEEEAPPPPPPSIDRDAVAKAGRGFSGYRVADDRSFARESFLSHLAAADAVCIGERHDQPLDHFAELSLVDALGERRAMRGFELGVGFEMVRARFQGNLTNYLGETSSLEKFRVGSAWAQEWGYPLEYYAPVFDAVRDNRAVGVALGVDRDLSHAIAESGVDGLPPAMSRLLPAELDFENQEHRALFDALTEEHPHGDPENMYEAQVVWDEAMAERSAGFLGARAPGRKLLIVAGVAHCHRQAIPARLARRGNFRVVSVIPVETQPEKPRSSGEPTADERLLGGYDYQLVYDAK